MPDEPTGLALLRKPFPENQIGKLPKPFKADAPKGTCKECGGYHGLPAMHLDFVGHAALTDRFLDVDPAWTYEFMAVDSNGAPVFDANGGLWIKLTILGVTRPGYGDAQGKKGGNAVKEAIGDALRNAGMRFGAALDLWHKGDLHEFKEAQGATAAPEMPVAPPAWRARVVAAPDLATLSDIHAEAVAEGWATPDLMAALTSRKKQL